MTTVAFWGPIIAAVVALVRYLSRSPERSALPPPQRSTPEQLLAERYARGEIEVEEYRQRLEVLRSPSGESPVAKPQATRGAAVLLEFSGSKQADDRGGTNVYRCLGGIQ